MSGLDHLPKLQSLVIHDTPEEEFIISKEQDTLNLLLVGMDNCEVQILALGIFLCGTIKLAEVFGKDGTVLNIHMPADFSYLYIAIEFFYGEVEIVTIKLQECSTSWNDVYELAFKHDQLLTSLDYLDKTMKNILETWESVYLMEMQLKLNSYCVEEPEMVSTNLLELLIYGIISDRMDQFLKKDLTDKGIKKIGLSIESSHTNVQKLVVKHLSEVTNQILFQLVEISGMSLKKYKCLGLTEHSVEKALKSVNKFLMKCNEVQIVIEESLTKYKLFFKWLYGMMIKLNDESLAGDPALTEMSQQELNLLAEYIYNLGETAKANNYKLDRVGQYFADKELEFPYEAHNQWWGLMRDNPCLEENALIVQPQKKLSLAQQFSAVKRDLMDIFAQNKSFFDKTFTLYNNVLVDGHNTTDLVVRNHKVSMVDLPNHKLLVCCVDRGGYDFSFYELMAYDDGHEVTRRSTTGYYMCAGTKQTVHDVQFYSQDHLSVLTETVDPSGNRNSLFLQVSTNGLRGFCTTDGLSMCRIGGGPADDDYACRRLGDYAYRTVDNMMATSFAVSGTRKVAVLLSHSRHKVRLFEMEADEEEDEEDDSTMDSSATN